MKKAIITVAVATLLLTSCGTTVETITDSTQPTPTTEETTSESAETLQTTTKESETTVVTTTESSGEVMFQENSADNDESDEEFFEATKKYILEDQLNQPASECIYWSEAFLDTVDFKTMYQNYLNDGNKAGDTKAFNEYIASHSKAPDNWQELFQVDFKKNYDQPIDSYEDLGNGMYAVHIIINGQDKPFVVVNSVTGWYHG